MLFRSVAINNLDTYSAQSSPYFKGSQTFKVGISGMNYIDHKLFIEFDNGLLLKLNGLGANNINGTFQISSNDSGTQITNVNNAPFYDGDQYFG